jgi:hypothetical protein
MKHNSHDSPSEQREAERELFIIQHALYASSNHKTMLLSNFKTTHGAQNYRYSQYISKSNNSEKVKGTTKTRKRLI